MNHNYYVYIMTNRVNKVLYTGVTSDIRKRVYEHKSKMVKGFTEKYNCNKLVYCEHNTDIKQAIQREKQIKGWLRARKIELVEKENPEWNEIEI